MSLEALGIAFQKVVIGFDGGTMSKRRLGTNEPHQVWMAICYETPDLLADPKQ